MNVDYQNVYTFLRNDYLWSYIRTSLQSSGNKIYSTETRRYGIRRERDYDCSVLHNVNTRSALAGRIQRLCRSSIALANPEKRSSFGIPSEARV